jgi:hypothetical protein
VKTRRAQPDREQEKGPLESLGKAASASISLAVGRAPMSLPLNVGIARVDRARILVVGVGLLTLVLALFDRALLVASLLAWVATLRVHVHSCVALASDDQNVNGNLQSAFPPGPGHECSGHAGCLAHRTHCSTQP